MIEDQSDTHPHLEFSTTGKPWLQKLMVISLNLTTLWKCEICRRKIPHHPTKGHRISYAGNGICQVCKNDQERKQNHRQRMAETKEAHSIKMAKLRTELDQQHAELVELGIYQDGPPPKWL